MDSIEVNLTAVIVDIPITEGSLTEVKINFSKSLDIIDVDGQEFHSVHHFFVKDVSYLGFGEAHYLAAKWVLALSCSLTNPIILFTPIDLTDITAPVTLGGTPPKVTVNDVRTETHILRKSLDYVIRHEEQITLQETEILKTAKQLLTLGFSDRISEVKKSNILEAITEYQNALSTIDTATRYKTLFSALEKASLADKTKSLNDTEFDSAVSAFTKYSVEEIKDLRLLNNRLKHYNRNKKDLALLSELMNNSREMIKKLKLVTDKAILDRIGEA